MVSEENFRVYIKKNQTKPSYTCLKKNNFFNLPLTETTHNNKPPQNPTSPIHRNGYTNEINESKTFGL